MKHFKVSNSLDHPIWACDQRKQIIERKKNGDEKQLDDWCLTFCLEVHKERG